MQSMESSTTGKYIDIEYVTVTSVDINSRIEYIYGVYNLGSKGAILKPAIPLCRNL